MNIASMEEAGNDSRNQIEIVHVSLRQTAEIRGFPRYSLYSLDLGRFGSPLKEE